MERRLSANALRSAGFHMERSGNARANAAGVQIVDVAVDHGYWPGVIHARPGIPLRVMFHRYDASEWAERVVFSAPRIERRLPMSATTPVDLPAQAAGEVRFTSALGRYVGRIELADEPDSILGRLRLGAGRLDLPIRNGLAIWIGTLPVFAALAVLGLDTQTAIVAAGATLLSCIAGCVWALGHGRTEP